MLCWSSSLPSPNQISLILNGTSALEAHQPRLILKPFRHRTISWISFGIRYYTKKKSIPPPPKKTHLLLQGFKTVPKQRESLSPFDKLAPSYGRSTYVRGSACISKKLHSRHNALYPLHTPDPRFFLNLGKRAHRSPLTRINLSNSDG
jgi:hypothetical protein